MATIIHTDLKCPHCGFMNRVAIDTDDLYKMEIHYCSIDDGGCDRPFVVKYSAIIKTEIFKIEGQGEGDENVQ